MSAFEELQRQLMDSVADRARAGRSSAAVSLARWWRTRVASNVPLAAMLPLLFVVAVLGATLFARVGPGGGVAAGGHALVASAEAPCGPCQAVGGRLHAPPSEEAFPEGAATSVRQRRDVRIRYGRPIVRVVPQSAPVG